MFPSNFFTEAMIRGSKFPTWKDYRSEGCLGFGAVANWMLTISTFAMRIKVAVIRFHVSINSHRAFANLNCICSHFQVYTIFHNLSTS